VLLQATGLGALMDSRFGIRRSNWRLIDAVEGVVSDQGPRVYVERIRRERHPSLIVDSFLLEIDFLRIEVGDIIVARQIVRQNQRRAGRHLFVLKIPRLVVPYHCV